MKPKTKTPKTEELQHKADPLDDTIMITVVTFTGKSTLYDLIHKIGVAEKTVYWNDVEKPTPKSRRTLKNPTEIRRVEHDYGFIFKDGFEIKHVQKKFWKHIKAPIKEIRERL